MNNLMACRVCLASDILLHSISGCQLQDIYEKFTETSLDTGNKKPTCVCYICFSLLKKFQKFIEKSKKSDQLLEQIINSGLKLSVNSLELFSKHQTEISWSLSKTTPVTLICATEEEVKVETPIETEYVDSEIDMWDQSEALKSDDDDNEEKILSKKDQLQQMLERSKSLNYQNSLFKCDVKPFENCQEKYDEVLHLPKKCKSDNDIEKEILKNQAPLTKTDKGEENKAQNEDNGKTPYFKICPIETIISNNETTTSNINSDIKNSKIEANSNAQAAALRSIFICDVCKKEYHRKIFIENHIKKWHTIKGHDDVLKNKNKYRCSYCTKCFATNGTLARHVRTHTGEKPYKCSYCTKCFTQSGGLAAHVRIHTGEKLYKCSYCTKCFTSRHVLAIHVRTHTGEKPYKCSYCTKCFTQSGELAAHVRIHTGEKPYKCSYCIKCFTISSNLAQHVKTHTGEKPYKCSHCTKCFIKSSDLNAHVRIHTGEKPYKCSYCKKCFSHSSNLAQHVKTHTGEKPYKCSYCTKCFTGSSDLAKHVKIHIRKKDKIMN